MLKCGYWNAVETNVTCHINVWNTDFSITWTSIYLLDCKLPNWCWHGWTTVWSFADNIKVSLWVIQMPVWSITPWLPHCLLPLSVSLSLLLSIPTCPSVCPATCPHIHVSRCQCACLSVCMSLCCPDCLVYGVCEAGKTTREYATPISTSDTAKVAPNGQHYYVQVLDVSDDK